MKEFVEKILAPVNSGKLNPSSTQTVCDFVDNIYLKEYVEKNLRAATKKQYKDVWENHLKPRMGKLTLRDFRTVHGEQMLAKIAEQAELGRSSLKHCKAFLSGAFKQAKRLGILDGINPIQDVSIPRVPEPEEDTYAYNLSEINSMLAVLPQPAWTVVQTAALTGFSKGELRGLQWGDFDGSTLTVRRVVWNSVTNEPKTKRRRASIAVVKRLADVLEAHKLRAAKLAQPTSRSSRRVTGSPRTWIILCAASSFRRLPAARSAGKPSQSTSRKRISSSAIIPFPTGTDGTHSGAASPPTCMSLVWTIKPFRGFCGTAPSRSHKTFTSSP